MLKHNSQSDLKNIFNNIGHPKGSLKLRYHRLEANNLIFISSINQYAKREEGKLSHIIKCGNKLLTNLDYLQHVLQPVLH